MQCDMKIPRGLNSEILIADVSVQKCIAFDAARKPGLLCRARTENLERGTPFTLMHR